VGGGPLPALKSRRPASVCSAPLACAGAVARTAWRQMPAVVRQSGFRFRLVLKPRPLGPVQRLVGRTTWLSERVIAQLPETCCLTFCLGQVPTALLESRLARQLSRLRRVPGQLPLPPFCQRPAASWWDRAGAWARCLACRSDRPRPVPLAQAVAGWRPEPLCPYPPSIPLLIPGERIDQGAGLSGFQEQRTVWPGQDPLISREGCGSEGWPWRWRPGESIRIPHPVSSRCCRCWPPGSLLWPGICDPMAYLMRLRGTPRLSVPLP